MCVGCGGSGGGLYLESETTSTSSGTLAQSCHSWLELMFIMYTSTCAIHVHVCHHVIRSMKIIMSAVLACGTAAQLVAQLVAF